MDIGDQELQKELKAIFAFYDTDRIDCVEPATAIQIWRKMGILFDPADVESERVVSFSTFLRLTRKYVNLMAGDEDGEAVGVFGLLDPTSSGVARTADVKRLLADVGAQWSDAEVQALVDRIDSGPCNGEGFLEQDLIDFLRHSEQR